MKKLIYLNVIILMAVLACKKEPVPLSPNNNDDNTEKEHLTMTVDGADYEFVNGEEGYASFFSASKSIGDSSRGEFSGGLTNYVEEGAGAQIWVGELHWEGGIMPEDTFYNFFPEEGSMPFQYIEQIDSISFRQFNDGVNVVFWDEDGNIYESQRATQDASSYFTFKKLKSGKTPLDDAPYVQLECEFMCKAYSEDIEKEVTITNGKGKISISGI